MKNNNIPGGGGCGLGVGGWGLGVGVASIISSEVINLGLGLISSFKVICVGGGAGGGDDEDFWLEGVIDLLGFEFVVFCLFNAGDLAGDLI